MVCLFCVGVLVVGGLCVGVGVWSFVHLLIMLAMGAPPWLFMWYPSVSRYLVFDVVFRSLWLSIICMWGVVRSCSSEFSNSIFMLVVLQSGM